MRASFGSPWSLEEERRRRDALVTVVLSQSVADKVYKALEKRALLDATQLRRPREPHFRSFFASFRLHRRQLFFISFFVCSWLFVFLSATRGIASLRDRWPYCVETIVGLSVSTTTQCRKGAEGTAAD